MKYRLIMACALVFVFTFTMVLTMYNSAYAAGRFNCWQGLNCCVVMCPDDELLSATKGSVGAGTSDGMRYDELSE